MRLVLWGALVVLGQSLGGGWLAGAVMLALLLGVSLAGSHLRRLFRRARFLLLTIGLFFACGTPGEALLPILGAASPTLAGLEMATQHCARLALVLALLALLFQTTTSSQLVAGIFGLLKPFSTLGLSRERVALRLMLVLQYAEEQKGEGRLKSWKQWLNWLECQDGGTEPEPVRIAVAPLQGADFAVLALLLLASFSLLLKF